MALRRAAATSAVNLEERLWRAAMISQAEFSNGPPKPDHRTVQAAGFGGSDWDGMERRRGGPVYHFGGSSGGGGGGSKIEMAIVSVLAAAITALIGLFTVNEWMQKPLKSDISTLTLRIDRAMEEAKEWRLETSATVRGGFSDVQNRMNDLVPENVLVERWQGLQAVDRVHGEALAKLNERIYEIEKDANESLNDVRMLVQSIKDQLNREAGRDDPAAGRQR